VNGRTEVVTVILTGVAVNAFAGAIIGLVMSIVDDAALRSVTFWTLGSVSTASWTSVASIAVAGVIGFALLPLVVRPLDLLALGERNAANLGVDVMRTRAIAIVITAILAGAAVATAGMLVFVGLVVPHAMRLVVGPRHRGLVIASALAGAFLIVTADLLARTVVAPREIPLGVLTGLIGAPAFFILLRREHARRGAWA
jgi:iron complex transport system permease protein